MLRVKLEADWGESDNEELCLKHVSEDTEEDGNHDGLAASDDAGSNNKDDMTAQIVTDPGSESQHSKISCDASIITKTPIVHIQSARGSVGFVSGNRNFKAVIGFRRYGQRSNTTPLAKPRNTPLLAKPPSSAPPLPSRRHA